MWLSVGGCFVQVNEARNLPVLASSTFNDIGRPRRCFRGIICYRMPSVFMYNLSGDG